MSHKFVLNSRNTAPGLPPSMNVGTIEVTEEDLEYEYELVQRIYDEVGEGLFTVQCNFGNKKSYDDDRPKKGMKTLWKGRIEVEDDEDLTYITLESKLVDLTWVKIREPPISGRWKRCRKPVSGFEKGREDLLS